MKSDDRIPTNGQHKGVPLHDCQDEARLTVVRREIDTVLEINDAILLLEIAPDATWSPEARLLAAARLRAMHELATEDRRVRPNFDLKFVDAVVAGLDSQNWRDPWHFASLLDHGPAPGEQGPVPRDEPLSDDHNTSTTRRASL